MRGERRAGAVLLRGGVLAATWVALTVAAAVPLVWFGIWVPLVAVPVLLVAAAWSWRLTRGVPVQPAPVWSAALTVVVTVGFGLWAAATSAEHVVLRRDAGSYALFAQHLGTAGQLPVDPALVTFGGAAALGDPAFTLASPAFYQVGTTTGADVVPQFLLGAPALFSIGWWTAGWVGLLVVPAVLGASAVLAVAGLATRLVGPRSAPLAAAALALAQPVLHAARSTYSEPAALLLLTGALSLLAVATSLPVPAPAPAGTRVGVREADRLDRVPRARRFALAAGLLLGSVALLRVDALREAIFAVPVVALLVARRHPAAWPFAIGVGVSTGFAAVSALVFSRPYLDSIRGSLLPLLALGVLVVAGCSLAVLVARVLVGRDRSLPARAPAAAAAGIVAGCVVLATRPWWLVVRKDPDDPGSRVVAGLQVAQGLPLDAGRTYAEDSLVWAGWYLGTPALLLAAVAAAALVVRLVAAVRDDDPLPAWTGPLLIALASTAATLWRPGITPDHPWADRRLVAVVLPVLVLLATAAVAEGVRLARRRSSAPVLVTAGVGGCLLLLVPPLVATWPVATQRTEQGQLRAVQQVCGALRGGDVVLAVDERARLEWPQVLRGVCDVPAASLRGEGPELASAVQRAAERVRAAGGRPVLIAASDPSVLTELGTTPVQVADLRTTEDQRLLVRRPDGHAPLDVHVWLAEAPPGPGASGG